VRKKIEPFMAKIKTKAFYNHCYNDMERYGYSIFGMCCGDIINSGILSEKCKYCPYLVKE
jgi:hypothetical protein